MRTAPIFLMNVASPPAPYPRGGVGGLGTSLFLAVVMTAVGSDNQVAWSLEPSLQTALGFSICRKTYIICSNWYCLVITTTLCPLTDQLVISN